MNQATRFGVQLHISQTDVIVVMSFSINSHWGYSLGVDRSVGVVEGPDDIMSKPGARYDGTKP